ncbi:FAD:protein FMN transferase [Algibacillus agarilyticus]|uniref:FAD:protein FMN transferase n=1 Tax=Algibacillus agarilyticus TaxID=2234133 RepID=UPI001E5FB85F|nr:FAD:protein FMN transferase [Algibacillus agarilyticus]
MRLLKSISQSISIICLLLFLASCVDSSKSEMTQVMLQGKTMGTTFSVKFYATEQQLLTEQFYNDIDELLETVNDQMSTYRHDSEISRFNSHATDEPFVVSTDTAYVVKKAIEIGVSTQGALDITVGPLVNLWGFGPSGKVVQVPTDEELVLAKDFIGLDKILVKGRSLIKTQDQLYIDLSAIAKGFAVDKIAEYLDDKSISRYLVEVGGEMRATGKKLDGSNWRVAIEKPASHDRGIQQIISLIDKGIATSGDYRNYFEQDGTRFSHTIDPVTAKPITHKLASVTVIHDSAMMADGFATAINVLGTEKGLAFAEKNNLAIYLVIKSPQGFEVKYSKAFSPYLN